MIRLHRLCLPVVPVMFAIAVASASAGAREIKHSTPGSGTCDHAATAEGAARKPASPAASRPAREDKARPGLHADSPPSGRLQSPRWHSFLPGMFR